MSELTSQLYFTCESTTPDVNRSELTSHLYFNCTLTTAELQ